MDYISDSFRENSEAETEFGRDTGVRFDDLIIGDAYFDVGQDPNYTFHAGFAGYYRGLLGAWILAQDVSGSVTLGTSVGQDLGSVIIAPGDFDDSKEPNSLQPDQSYWSWDGGYGEGNLELTLQPSGVSGSQAFDTSISVSPNTGEDYFPGWITISNNNTLPSQVTSVGDVNLDGYDDFALVVRVSQDPEEHAIRIYSGEPPGAGSQTVLWNLTSLDNRPLIGTRGAKRTSVRRIGDVNGDGSDDWAIVTGLDTGSDGVADKTVIAIFGTNVFSINTPGPLPLATPRIGGNRMAEIGRDVFIHVTNGIPNQTGVVHRASGLSGPLSVCGGQLRVSGIMIPFTFDANGEAFVFDPLEYDPALIGSKRYYQVQTDPYATYPCRLSVIRDVRLEDSTNPDEL